MLTAVADITVRSPNGVVAATVEVKNPMEFTPDIASEYKDICAESGTVLPDAYFLLVSQDYGYL